MKAGGAGARELGDREGRFRLPEAVVRCSAMLVLLGTFVDLAQGTALRRAYKRFFRGNIYALREIDDKVDKVGVRGARLEFSMRAV